MVWRMIGLCILLAACQVKSSDAANATQSSRTAALTETASANAPQTGDNGIAVATPSGKKSTAVADPCSDERNPAFDPDKCAEPDARVDAYAGTWQVTNVAVTSGGAQAFGKDDPAIVGSQFSISAQEIRWTRKASDSFNADDVCTVPSASAMPPVVEKEEGGALVAALRSFAIKQRGTLHRFGCVNSGRWGPGETGGNALFVPVGQSQLALQWYDGSTLLAKRVK